MKNLSSFNAFEFDEEHVCLCDDVRVVRLCRPVSRVSSPILSSLCTVDKSSTCPWFNLAPVAVLNAGLLVVVWLSCRLVSRWIGQILVGYVTASIKHLTLRLQIRFCAVRSITSPTCLCRVAGHRSYVTHSLTTAWSLTTGHRWPSGHYDRRRLRCIAAAFVIGLTAAVCWWHDLTFDLSCDLSYENYTLNVNRSPVFISHMPHGYSLYNSLLSCVFCRLYCRLLTATTVIH